MYYAIQTKITPGWFSKGGLRNILKCKTDKQMLGKKNYHCSHFQGKTRNQNLIFKDNEGVLLMVCIVSLDSFKIPAKEMV